METFMGVQERLGEGVYYSPRLAKGNIKDYFKGQVQSYFGPVTDIGFMDKLRSTRWDIALVNEEIDYDRHMTYLDMLWSCLSGGGLIVMDFVEKHPPAKRAFSDFCTVHNREPMYFPTRYGVGIIQR